MNLPSSSEKHLRIATHEPTKTQKFYVGSTWHRLYAKMIDSILLAPVALWAFSAKDSMISLFRTGEVNYPWLNLGIWFAVVVSYHTVFLKWKGATPGKLIFGLKVVPFHDFRGAIPWESALLRSLGSVLSSSTGGILHYVLLLRRDRRHFFDLAADTVVVQTEPRFIPKIRYFIGGFLVLSSLSSANGIIKMYQNASINAQGIRMSFPEFKAIRDRFNQQAIKGLKKI